MATAILLNNFDMLHVFFLSPPCSLLQKGQHKQHLKTAISNRELEFWPSTVSNSSNPALTKKSCLVTRGNWFLPTRCLYREAASVSQLPPCQLSHVGKAKRIAHHQRSRQGRNSATELSAWEPSSASCLLFYNIHVIEKGNSYK